MFELLQIVPLAALMFAATNADDLVLLGVFFRGPAIARARSSWASSPASVH